MGPADKIRDAPADLVPYPYAPLSAKRWRGGLYAVLLACLFCGPVFVEETQLKGQGRSREDSLNEKERITLETLDIPIAVPPSG